jgi:hypothetical protein
VQIREKHFPTGSPLIRQTFVLSPAAPGNSATDDLLAAVKPGYRFRIVQVTAFAVGVTATASCTVKIGSTAALTGAITPVAGDLVDGTIDTDADTGGATDEINVHATTDGTGNITGGWNVAVTVEPLGLIG